MVFDINKAQRSLPVFDLVHPVLVLAFFIYVIFLSMFSMQPVLLLISFIGALLFSFFVRGWSATLKVLQWQLPLVLLCAGINPLFSMSGSTELLRMGSYALYFEALAFGVCMGLLLCSTILWFMNASLVLTTDKIMSVLGTTMPTIALMISMIMRLVPQFVGRKAFINSAARAVSAADIAQHPCTAPKQKKHSKVHGRLRVVSVLMGWSLEDSLETADSMKARGWSAVKKRTCYRRYRFGTFELICATLLTLSALICAIVAWLAVSQYRFYPIMSTLALWWGYIPYACFMGAPLLVGLLDDLRWKRLS